MIRLVIRNSPSQNTNGADLRATWLDIAPVLRVDRVHCVKFLHVRQVHRHLDDIVDIGARRLQDPREVLDDLFLTPLVHQRRLQE